MLPAILPAQQRLMRSLANLGIYQDDEDEDNVESSKTSTPVGEKTIPKEENNLNSSKTLTPGSDHAIEDKDGNAQSEAINGNDDIGKESKSADMVKGNAVGDKDADMVEKPYDGLETRDIEATESELSTSLKSVSTNGPVVYLNSPETNYSPDFASMNSKIGCVMDSIKPGMYLRVINGCIETPGHFHVILEENAHILEDFMAELQLYFQRTSGEPLKYGNEFLLMPPFDILSPGLPVGIRRSTDNKWHRGVVIRKFTKEKVVRVYYIDYGDFEDAHVWNIQIIPKTFLNAMKAQGIRCRALLGKNYNYKTPTGYPVYFNAGGGWKDAEGDIMRRLVQDQTLGLKFIKAKTDVLGPYWLVYIHMMDGDSNRISLHHVEQKVLEMYRNTYFPHDEDYEDTPKEIEFTLLSSDQ